MVKYYAIKVNDKEFVNKYFCEYAETFFVSKSEINLFDLEAYLYEKKIYAENSMKFVKDKLHYMNENLEEYELKSLEVVEVDINIYYKDMDVYSEIEVSDIVQ